LDAGEEGVWVGGKKTLNMTKKNYDINWGPGHQGKRPTGGGDGLGKKKGLMLPMGEDRTKHTGGEETKSFNEKEWGGRET